MVVKVLLFYVSLDVVWANEAFLALAFLLSAHSLVLFWMFFFFSSKQAQIDCLRVEQSKSRSSNTHNCSWRTSQLLLETGGRRDHHAESTHEMREHLYKSNSLCEQLPQLSFLLLKLSVSQQGPLSFISTSPWQQTSCHTPGTLG